MGAGARFHEPAAGTETRSTPTGVIRAALHPTQVWDTSVDQLLDAGVGYRAEIPIREREPAATLHGPYAEVGLYPVRLPIGRTTRLRWGGYGSADLELASPHSVGFGGTLGTLLEVSGVSNGAFAGTDQDGAVAGVAHGQWAVGVFANASLRDVHGDFAQGLSAGLSVRMPFMAGIACCVWPSSDDSDSGKKRKRHHERKRRDRKPREYRAAEPRRER